MKHVFPVCLHPQDYTFPEGRDFALPTVFSQHAEVTFFLIMEIFSVEFTFLAWGFYFEFP